MDEIKKLISKNDLEFAFSKLTSLIKTLDDDNLHNSLLSIQSRFNKIKKEKRNGLKIDEHEENKITNDLLSLVNYFEENIKQNKLTEESLFKVLEIFNRKSKEFNSQKNNNIDKTHELYNIRLKLHEQLFKEFDEKIENLSTEILFERILFIKKLESIDINFINSIRKEESIKWYEKATLVYSLVIAVVNEFNVQKLDLLIDFIFDNEENVRDIALVGLFLGIYNRKNRIDFFPSIKRKLENLKELERVKKSFQILSTIFNLELYKFSFLPFGKFNLEEFNLMLLKTAYETNLMGDILNTLIPNVEGKNTNNNIINDVFKMEVSNLESNYDFEQLSYFKKPHKWFIPFFRKNDIITQTITDAKTDISTSDIIDFIQENIFLSDIEKYNFCINLQEDKNLEQMLPILNIAFEVFKDVMSEELENEDFKFLVKYIQIMKNIYIFFKYFPQEEFDNKTKNKLSIYKSSLYEVILKDQTNITNILKDSLKKNDTIVKKIFTKYVEKISNHFNILENGIKTIFSEKNIQAILNLISGNLDTSKKLFQSIIDENIGNSNNMRAYIGLGHIAYCQGEKKEALRLYIIAKEKHQNSDEFLIILKRDYFYLKVYNISKEEYDNFILKV